MSKSWAGGSTSAWRRVRRQVLVRDDYLCQIKIRGTCTGDDPTYLVAACAPCNLAIGDPTQQPDPQPRRMTQW